MKIEEIKTNNLIAYGLNNRKHSDIQVDRIATSIKEFGFNQPLVVGEDDVVIVGHGRLMAAQKLGLETVPVIRKTDLTEAQIKAYRILDNKLQNDSEWDVENLRVELSALEELNFDMELCGIGELQKLFPSDDDSDQLQETEADGLKKTSVVKSGDQIELGQHRLMCGDSTDLDSVMALVAGNEVDMVLTDPPYGVSYEGRTSEKLTIENDDLDEAELEKPIRAAFDCAEIVSRGGAYWYATVPAGPLHLLFASDWKRRGFLRQILVWAKESMALGHSEYRYQHEPILFGWKPGDRHKNPDRTRTSLWSYPRPAANREHPTMKPVALWAQAIRDGSVKGEIVYDPFCGSGTTVLAAEQLGRRCYGMELSPLYCDVIVRRYFRFCGENGLDPQCRINGQKVDPSYFEEN